MVQTVQDINTQRNNALQDEVEQSRRSVTHQVVGAIVLALVLALSLGIWLARPNEAACPCANWPCPC